jgi:hypothetical protein
VIIETAIPGYINMTGPTNPIAATAEAAVGIGVIIGAVAPAHETKTNHAMS